MNRRIAKKIVRWLYRPARWRPYSVDQLRRALLRVYKSPLQLTDHNAHWRDGGFGRPPGGFDRCMVITDKLCILEQRHRLHDVKRFEGRLTFYPRRP